MQMKAIMRYFYTIISMAKVKNAGVPSVCEDVEQPELKQYFAKGNAK